ncbi:Fc.00g025080.m01.CDS01 [Cosmosporella sp. VM-42]
MSPAAVLPLPNSGQSRSSPKTLNATLLTIENVSSEAEREVPGPDDPIRKTQSCTTSHMLLANWTKEGGWEAPRIQPYGNFSIPPTASVLHYGTECFEGLKAYRGKDGKLRLFRPQKNCERLRKYALRAGLPGFDPAELAKLVDMFLEVDGKRWLPDAGTFLYIRPALVGTQAALGVGKPSKAMLFVIAVLFPQFGQLGPGLKLLCSEGQVRAWPGGFGNAKLGANYAPTLAAQEAANKKGFIQTLWLFAPEDAVTEAGASNFFVVIENKKTNRPELITPPIGDIILDGVTRKSVFELAIARLSNKLDMSERELKMEELVRANEEGRLVEAFVTGTAFFIAPVGLIRYKEKDLLIGKLDKMGVLEAPFANQIKQWLASIMYGEEKHDWAHLIKED